MPDDVTSTSTSVPDPDGPGGDAAGRAPGDRSDAAGRPPGDRSDAAGGAPDDSGAAPRPRRRHRRATGGVAVPASARPASDDPLLPVRSPDDEDTGWGEGPSGNDERLRRDVPPHW